MRIFEIFTEKNRVLLKAMVSTDFKLRYQQSFLGYIWSVLKPLLLFSVMYMVFVRFLKFGADVPHFSVGLLLGITMWNFFAETTAGAMGSVVSHGDLMRKINFSKFVVVISSALSALINFAINFVVVLIFALINGVQISWSALLIIPLTLELFVISLGVGFFLGALYVTFRDLSPIWEVVMQAGFYATPIIYPVSLVATNLGPHYGPLLSRLILLNPLAQIVQDARHVLIAPENPTIWESFSNPLISMIPVLLCILIFIGGVSYFSSKSKNFAELV
ncbi:MULTISPECIES: ABC transporter permease [Bifidobacterium]|uniref:Transport permease protein n=1 Tax=Bifidobacterium psychraerophilum TaxID=218140 RepID=A0A087CLV7_9BIFI|nr:MULTISPECIES: ABC transporter permease [Bifidobacterium]KFI84257.1 Lipopolysaccharide exporter ABC transporter, permease [Bifidobacterium psychraerophilum]MCI1636406.1 ABC transporter permease [Bifidobacterium sp.]MCI1659826.1 ABC transporter permease [Bifidobacterium psychraerophilum]MCI1805270.1 ABC transporter permease [Bifidobacterium psychraerophilum]PKA94114.1 ABC-2 type transport system permease protein [Bifidobacterium psychraerophilum DSM 22366]